MRYYLDSNAWIYIFKSDVYGKLLAAFNSGAIDVALSEENIWELLEGPKIRPTDFARNKTLLEPFLLNREPDEIFVLDHSRLGLSKLPGTKATEVFSQHLEKKTNKSKAQHDAIHIVNSMDGQSTLVGCDNQVKSTALAAGAWWLCYRDFLKQNQWSVEGAPLCEKCRNSKGSLDSGNS